jgi:UDP-N-acetylglucosamine--N-acetylmuramyl-(pentapeptide) pyrophosphoryl-undecaprenol N-acetylglucosamine transferase
VSFITDAGRGSGEKVRARGYEADTFGIGGLPRRPGVAQARAVSRAVGGVARCLRLVRAQRPDVLLAAGGYVSTPAAYAARLRGVPVVVTEADAHLGLANRMSSRVGQRLCTAYPLAQHRRSQLVTGRPVDDAFFHVSRARAREEMSIPHGAVVLVVVGGSGGATRLNRAAWEAYGADAGMLVGGRPLVLLHVTGRRDFPEITREQPSCERYRVIEYCTDMPNLLAAADLVVSRPGGSVFELAAVGRAAVLVPSPNVTADHQRRNAEHFVARDAGLLEEDASFDGPRLRAVVESLLDPAADERRSELEQAMRELARPHAAADIADVCQSLAAAHWRQHSEGRS